MIDRSQLKKLNETANSIAKSAASGQWVKATDEWSAMEDQVESSTDGVNFYNIQIWGGSEKRSLLFARKNLTSFGEYTFVQGVFVMCVCVYVCVCVCVHAYVCVHLHAYMNYGEKNLTF